MDTNEKRERQIRRVRYFTNLKEGWRGRLASFPEYRAKSGKLNNRGVEAFMNFASGWGQSGPVEFVSDPLWWLIGVRGPDELDEFLANVGIDEIEGMEGR